MKILIKFFVFLTYLILIFTFDNIIFLLSLIIIELLFSLLFKISFKEILKNLLILLPFLILTYFFNVLWSNFNEANIIMVRLILAYIVTFVFSKVTPTIEVIKFIEMILMPFKFIGVNSKKAGMIAGISISMIPVLKDEIEQKKLALNSKGYKMKLNELDIMFKPIFISILKRTGEIEKNLISKGYQE